MITILCEKSDAGSNFATALGGYQGQLNGEDYQIVCASGHLYEMKSLEDMVDSDLVSQYTSWEVEHLPFDRSRIRWGTKLKPPKKISDTYTRDHGQIFSTIKQALDQSDSCIIATDDDPSGEGDTIAWEILLHANFRGQIYRCYFEDESAKSIHKALSPSNLKLIDQNDPGYVRGLTRQQFDFLTVQYSRMTTTLGRKNQVVGFKEVVRDGRLKTSMYSLVGQSEYAHETFKPHSQFTDSYVDEQGHIYLRKESPLFDNEQDGRNLVEKLSPSTVKEPKGPQTVHKAPPAMYDLASIGAKLKKRGFSADHTLAIAQKLYQENILSYPRTEDTVITQEQLNDLIPYVSDIATLVGVDMDELDLNAFRKERIGHGAHGANRPGLNVPASLDDLKRFGDIAPIIYEELARSFLAGFAKDAVYHKHTYTDETEQYVYSTSVNISRGFETILNPNIQGNLPTDANGEVKNLDDLTDEERDEWLKSSNLPEVGSPLTPQLYEKKAKRPAIATMTTLMNYLKRHNIGTGATRLSTYNEVTHKPRKNEPDRRMIIEDAKGRLRLSRLGRVSFMLMYGTLLADPGATKQLDGFLNDIKLGKRSREDVLKTFDIMFQKDRAKIIENVSKLSSLEKVKEKVSQYEKITGTFKPTGRDVTFSGGWGTHAFTDSEIALLLAGEEISFFKPIDKNKTFEQVKDDPTQLCKVFGKLAVREKFGFGFDLDRIEYPKKEEDIVEGVYAPTGQTISFSRRFGQHVFTDKEVEDLLAGKEISFSALSKANKQYTARGSLQYKEKFKSKTGEKVWQFAFPERTNN